MSIEQQIPAELKSGERLIWYGQPVSRRGLRSAVEHPLTLSLLLGGLARTQYALTDRRVFIIRNYSPGPRGETIPLEFVGDAAVVDRRPYDRGTVRLGSRYRSDSKQPAALRLSTVEHPHIVLDLILGTRQQRCIVLGQSP